MPNVSQIKFTGESAVGVPLDRGPGEFWGALGSPGGPWGALGSPGARRFAAPKPFWFSMAGPTPNEARWARLVSDEWDRNRWCRTWTALVQLLVSRAKQRGRVPLVLRNLLWVLYVKFNLRPGARERRAIKAAVAVP